METILINELSSKYGITINSKDAAHIIKQGGLKLKGQFDKSSTAIVDRLIQNYITRIFQEICKNNYNPDTLDLVFIGGTSLLLREKLMSLKGIFEKLLRAYLVRNVQNLTPPYI